MIRRNIYKWHRCLSLVIALPVLLWAVSGFLHPVMTNIRPRVASQVLQPIAVDTSRIKMPLGLALKQNGIDSLFSVRIVNIDTSWFYQVKTSGHGRLEYFSTLNGNRLKRGDWLYAQYLAKYFLEGKKQPGDSAPPMHASQQQDCCDAATDCVLNAPGAEVSGIALVDGFNEIYKSNNRLLPVYCVSFKRPDSIRIYVETAQSRFSLAVDDKRAAFTRFFSLVHTWGWLSVFGKGRLLLEILLMLASLATTLMGLYIFLISKRPKAGNGMAGARRRHRFTSLIASLFTLMFCFSGAWHAWAHLNETNTPSVENHGIAVWQINSTPAQWQQHANGKLSDVGLVYMNGQHYWQLYQLPVAVAKPANDLMKSRAIPAKAVVYVNVFDNTILPHGDELYARFLAGEISGFHKDQQLTASLVTKFNSEYNFIDKRLPVWRIHYAGKYNETFYIETSTGVLAKRLNASEKYEELSFALLHKHHFMDFAGKAWRDGCTMIGAALQVLMVLIGLMLYFRSRRKRNAAGYSKGSRK